MENPPLQKKLVEAAVVVGIKLMNDANYLSDGSITWGCGTDIHSQPVLESGLYNGRCGEGFFFAALYKATNDIKYKKISEQIFAPLQKNLKSPGYRNYLIKQLGLGLSGAGGILYALVKTNEFLNNEHMLVDAHNIAKSITPENIKGDRFLDIIKGTAGMLSGLITLANAGFEDLLETANECAQHLLATRVVDPVSKKRAWAPHANSYPVSGFGHGSSGIAHTMLQLHKRTLNDQLYEAALEAFSFERTLYRNNVMNWPDFRDQKDINMCSWCRGATGIGFSRLSAVEKCKKDDEGVIALDLFNALLKTNSLRLHQIDNLCCGNFGRIDFLLEAGKRLKNTSLRESALEKISSCLELRKKYEFQFPPKKSSRNQLSLGFWQGPAGCGYSLLRLADDDTFPCVLMME